MASGAAPFTPAQPASGVPRSAEVVEYGRFIEGQLQRTRTQVKWVEISGGMMTLAAAVLTYMIAVAVFDAWLVSGGLGTLGRWLCLLGLLAGGLGLFFWKVVPAILRPINPVFAAHTIEQSRPTLKNGLINFLLLRSRPDRFSPQVFQAVEQRAATELSHVEIDATVDRSRLIKLGYVLIGLMALAAVYKLVSPKDPFRSISRMVFPWAKIVPPSRVTIEELLPGDVEVFQGDYVDVSLIARGARDGEAVTLFYSTADGQTVDRAVSLKRPEDGYRHVGSFPSGTDGLKQNVEYYVRAGDALSPRHLVTVKPAPAIVVKSVDLDYPRYTGLSRTTQDRGDIQALEGTTVTIHAKANQDVSSAFVDFDCDGSRDQAMQAVGDTAAISFPLRLKEDGVTPEHASYLIRFTNPRGHENPQPIRHTIEVVRDLPPEVSFQAPTEAEVELPRNGALAIGVKARDPDYALSRVVLKFELRDKILAEQTLLAETRASEFRGQHVFDAAAWPLKPGDEVLYFAEVEDSKSPQPNNVRTLRQRIRIVDPVGAQKRDDQLKDAKEQCRGMKDGDGRPGGSGDGAPRADQPVDADEPNENRQPGAGKNDHPREDEDQGDADSSPDKPESPDSSSDDGQSGGQKSKTSKGKRSQDKPPGEGDKEQTEPGNGADSQPGEQDSHDPSGQSSDGQKKQPGQKDAGQPQGDAGSEKQPRGKKDQRNPRVDPETESGDAIEQINKHREKQPGEQQQPPNAGQPNKKDQQPQPGQKPQPEKGNDRGNDKQQPGGAEGSTDEQGEASDEQNPQGNSGQKSADGSAEDGAGDESSGSSDPQQSGNQQGQKSSPRKNGENQDDPSAAGESNSQDAAAQDRPGSSDAGGDEGESSDDPPKGAGQKKSSAGGKKPDKQSSPPSRQPQDDDADDSGEAASKDGQGKEAQGTPKEKGSKPDETADPMAAGGNPMPEQGNSGAGEATDEQTAPSDQQKKPHRDKKQKGPSGESDHEKGDDPSESKDDRESDSQGEESGDRAGGGKPSQGQQANKPGTGGDGQNTPSEEGSSQAEGKGTGRKSGQGGDQVEGTDPTSQSNQQKSGQGSKERSGGKQPGGANQPGSKSSPQGKAEQGDQPPPDANRTGGGGGNPQGQSPKNATQQGPGELGATDPNQPDRDDPQRPAVPSENSAGQADDPNLEYARQATDLALEYLKDQLDKDQPDQELLDKLGWSREDMEKFIRRWEEMKRKANERGPQRDESRRQLDDELRGLGLRPQGTKLGRDSVEKEQQRTRLRDSRRSEPPPEYAEQYKAYSQGKAKGRKSSGK